MKIEPVSVLIPALDDLELFEQHLPALFAELKRRAAGDEVIVVDDSGRDQLRPWFAKHWPSSRGVVNEVNRGFADSLLEAARVAQHDLILCLNPDVQVRPGFLEPLVDQMADPFVFAASPRVLLNGDSEQAESLTSLLFDDGVLRLEPRGVEDQTGELRPIPFAVGGAMLLRRVDFLQSDGFDALFKPFYWEDVDLCLQAWATGKRVVEVPRSIVEHHHRGTISRAVPDKVVRAAIEKNRLLLTWKYLDDEVLTRTHLARLLRDLIDCASTDRREEIVHLLLALDQLSEVAQARATRGQTQHSLEEVIRASDPR